MRVVLGDSSLARYVQGGGYWCIHLQYLLGLKALGHDVFLLERLCSKGNPDQDQQLIRSFFHRLQEYDLSGQAAVLLWNKDSHEANLDTATPYGKSMQEIRNVISDSDVLWNLCLGVRQPLLSMFRRRALIDLDPGILQVSASEVGPHLYDHHAYFSIGVKIHDADCEIPTLGLKWHTFFPFVYLPMWKAMPDPGAEAPFTSVTHWGWGKLKMNDRELSTSKRTAYMTYAALPSRARRPFELAANIHPDGPGADQTGDRELMEGHGWKLVDPWKVTDSPPAYQSYISRSRGEISCPRPIFRELKTGWFSDRSVCYLASGRPVLAEDTGFSDHLPTGKGLLTFQNMDEAVAGVSEIDANYDKHRRAARELAQEFLDYSKILPEMLNHCAAQ